MTKTAPTTKVANNIDNGLCVDIHNVTVYATRRDPCLIEETDPVTGETFLDIDGGGYILTSHHGEMPAFHTSHFDTLQGLANAMRECADLRTWRLVDHS
jgi:hypothetical protein